MDIQDDIAKVSDLVSKANDILVVTHENPTFDSIGSTLGLYLGLSALGKKVTVAAPDQITVEFSNFIGVNKITQDIAKKNFIISLDYVDGSIEKVSYNIEGNVFNLVIEPRPGFESFSEDKVHFSHGGASQDLIFTVDTIHLGGLKKVYESDKNLFASKPLVNIDRHPNNSHYGYLNIVDATVSSTAELVGKVMKGLGVKLTEDIASNLLNALYSATSNFQSPYVKSNTFDLAAECLNAGGKRFSKSISSPADEVSVQKQPKDEPKINEAGFQLGASQSGVYAQKKLQNPIGEARNVQPATSDIPPKPGTGQTPPADWLKPKIFKSSNLI